MSTVSCTELYWPVTVYGVPYIRYPFKPDLGSAAGAGRCDVAVLLAFLFWFSWAWRPDLCGSMHLLKISEHYFKSSVFTADYILLFIILRAFAYSEKCILLL